MPIRFSENPLISPPDLRPSTEGLEVTCLLNPGAFRFNGKVWLLVRVAERPRQTEVHMSFPVHEADGTIRIMEIALDDADLIKTDTRVIRYKGVDYLTTLSHLRLLCSDDGVHFYEPENSRPIFGRGPLETFGIEDCRVSKIDDTFYLTYTAVSENGVGVGMRTTRDWVEFTHHGMILPPHNKDCAIFEEKINDRFYALHRPSSVDLGGNYIWLAESPDALHWGNHKCIVRTRPRMWDSARVGAGAAPIKTPEGWLEIYHGADANHRYALGAVLLDAAEPSKVLARSAEPIMIPEEPYELTGFFGHVVFTNGHVLGSNSDTVRVYYGAADEHVCGADFSLREIFQGLQYF